MEGNNNKSNSKNKAQKAPFPTWTYEKPCPSMEWNNVSSVDLSVQIIADFVDPTTTTADHDGAADLVLVSTFAPPPNATSGKEGDDDEENEKEDEDDSEDVPSMMHWSSEKARMLDTTLGGALAQLVDENAKTFKKGAKVGATTPTLRLLQQQQSSSNDDSPKFVRYAVLGLGPHPSSDDNATTTTTTTTTKKSSTGTNIGQALGKAIAAKADAEKKVASVQVLLPNPTLLLSQSNNTTMTLFLRDLASAFFQNLYADNRYRGTSSAKRIAPDLTTVTLVFMSDSDVDDNAQDAEQAIRDGRALAQGIGMTRDIVNAPHNVLTSLSLADTARRIAADSNGRLSCTILDRKACEERNMGAYLGVARGSEAEPQFIHLTYTPPPNPSSSSTNITKVGIVGKGLLFDTGGYNIKTSMMELMKFDCGGAAAVLGAARAIAALAPPNVEAHFIVAACDNMINEKAYVPSDILIASNGKTIEVLNTDAEGRLTLADALVYADQEVGCERIIELSTLTGAIMVSLGKDIAGVFTNHDDLAEELADIAIATGEKSWRMPMESSYNEQLESKFADLKNIGTRYGGSITAGLFLQNFVHKKKPFAHIDIAGPVWNEKFGATGFGARLVTEWVTRQGQKGGAADADADITPSK